MNSKVPMSEKEAYEYFLNLFNIKFYSEAELKKRYAECEQHRKEWEDHSKKGEYEMRDYLSYDHSQKALEKLLQEIYDEHKTERENREEEISDYIDELDTSEKDFALWLLLRSYVERIKKEIPEHPNTTDEYKTYIFNRDIMVSINHLIEILGFNLWG